MRYQTRTYRAQTYLLRESLTRKDLIENKENNNVSNLLANKPNRGGKETINAVYCQPKLETKISQTPQLNDQNFPEELKRVYSQLVAQDYSNDILNHICERSTKSHGFLDAHSITAGLRSKMVDWMIEVLSSYKMTEQTFFRSVYLMDRYLQKCPEKQELKDLHLIGVTTMFSAAKYEEIHPLKLGLIYQKIARKKFKKSEILQKQSAIISALNFKLQESTIYDFVRHTTEQLKLSLPDRSLKYFHKILTYLSKMVLFSHELAEEDTALLSGAVLFIGLKTLQQVEATIQPQKKLSKISSLLHIEEDELIDLSRKVLELAKNFNRIYPNLGNLKKFNKFDYNEE